MPWAVAAAVATVGGAIISNNQNEVAADRANFRLTEGANSVRDQSQAQYDLEHQNLQPYLDAGGQALGQLSAGTAPGGEFDRPFTMSDFNQDPGRIFRFEQGNLALQRSQAATTGVLSGGAVKEALKFNSDLASQEYGAAHNRFESDRNSKFDRLGKLGDVGTWATSALNLAGEQNVNRRTGATEDIANSGAASAIAIGNSRSQEANTISSAIAQLLAGYGGGSSGIGGSGGSGVSGGPASNSSMYTYKPGIFGG